MAKCILLTGAPEADALTWDDTTLQTSFESPVKRFLGHKTSPARTAIEKCTYSIPKWRAVHLSNDAAYGNDGSNDDDGPQTQFLSFAHNASNNHQTLNFLEHSLARLNDMDSSQIAPVASDTTFITPGGSFTGTSFGSTSYPTSYGESFSTTYSTQKDQDPTQQQEVRLQGVVTDLKRIPHADHLLRIAPQTVTVNLLAAVITVSPSRTVRLRKRGGGEMEIIELLIGDETRAGFSISFWLTPTESQRKTPADDLGIRSALRDLRAGDIVLLQNIALSGFRGCVYGQSLSRRFARNSTTLAVLHAEIGQSLSVQVKAKWERVRDWSYDFIGRETTRASTVGTVSRSGKGKKGQLLLPPDTQSPVKSI